MTPLETTCFLVSLVKVAPGASLLATTPLLDPTPMATDGTADTGDAEEEEDDVDEEDEDASSVDVEDVLRSRGGLR